MGELDHWHPVLRSEEVSRKPRAVRVAGNEIVVFRTASGTLGAFPDRCPHRGARLSLGRVEGERLECPYHGWQWETNGRGHSPATPTAKPCAQAFDVLERQGAVWIKRQGAAAAFPRFDIEGFHEVDRVRKIANAPLELVLDNFIEVEHTPSVHAFLGYPPDRMHEVEHRVVIEGDSIYVQNVGPLRKLPSPVYPIFGIPRDAWFVDEWTTYFSPIYTVYDQYFVDPLTRKRTGDLTRIGVFFTPLDEARTEVFVMVYSSASPWGLLGFDLARHALLAAFARIEVTLDVRLLGKLADKRTQIKGNQLARFDKALLATRERIDRIYRGGDPYPAVPESTATLSRGGRG
jgi:vanillate O-demethylase monooxygenase subunit